MKSIRYLIVSIIILFSCNSKENIGNKIDNRKEHPKSIIPDTICTFFPSYQTNNKCKLVRSYVKGVVHDKPLFLRKFSIYYRVEIYEYINSEFKKETFNEIKSELKESYKVNDKNYFIIGSEKYLLKQYDELFLKKKI